MLHLAQVQKHSAPNGIELELLATQTSENHWAIDKRGIVVAKASALPALAHLNAGMLVLVEVDASGQFIHIEAATEWILNLLQQQSNYQPASLLEEEEERIEQWRQELTLQSQDITRRNLEIETRREQMEALEDSLKAEKEKLAAQKAALEAHQSGVSDGG